MKWSPAASRSPSDVERRGVTPLLKWAMTATIARSSQKFCATSVPSRGSALSSCWTSSIFRPEMPPAAFASSKYILIPLLPALPEEGLGARQRRGRPDADGGLLGARDRRR